MLATISTLAVVLGVLAALARIVALARKSTLAGRLADAVLLFAGIVVLGSVALTGTWTPAVLDARPFEDPRLAGTIALGAAALLSALTLLSARGSGARAVSAMAPLAIGSAAPPALLFFMGLHGGLPLTAAALGGGTIGLSLFALPALARGTGPVGRAVLASGVALVAIGAAMSVCGARAGATDASHMPQGSLFSGPALIVREVSAASAAPRHPVVWLAKGDSVAVGEARLTFMKFRIENRAGVHMYADIEVTRGGMSTRVSPVVYASAQGEQPVPVAVAGVGSILIAGMDADHGRVALLVPGAGDEQAVPAREFTHARRPGLELAWAGLVIALLATMPRLWKDASSSFGTRRA